MSASKNIYGEEEVGTDDLNLKSIIICYCFFFLFLEPGIRICVAVPRLNHPKQILICIYSILAELISQSFGNVVNGKMINETVVQQKNIDKRAIE